MTLSSTDLLSILFLLENDRKNIPRESEGAAWGEFLKVFSPRLKNISEELRRELLEAHLMSVEDFDVFDTDQVSQWKARNEDRLAAVAKALRDQGL